MSVWCTCYQVRTVRRLSQPEPEHSLQPSCCVFVHFSSPRATATTLSSNICLHTRGDLWQSHRTFSFRRLFIGWNETSHWGWTCQYYQHLYPQKQMTEQINPGNLESKYHYLGFIFSTWFTHQEEVLIV